MTFRFIALRLAAALSLLLAVSVLAFLLVQLLSGSVYELLLDRAATPEAVAALEAELGLTDPLPVQYGRWLLGVLRGDWGVSFQNKRPVAQLLPNIAGPLIVQLSQLCGAVLKRFIIC